MCVLSILGIHSNQFPCITYTLWPYIQNTCIYFVVYLFTCVYYTRIHSIVHIYIYTYAPCIDTRGHGTPGAVLGQPTLPIMRPNCRCRGSHVGAMLSCRDWRTGCGNRTPQACGISKSMVVPKQYCMT